MPARVCVPVENSMRFIETKEVSPLVTKVTIKVCYVSDQPNRNGSIITKELAESQLAPSLRGSPIVGYFDKDTNDFDQHTKDISIDNNGGYKLVDLTKPYGFVDLNANVWFQSFIEDGITREYLCTEGYVWTETYPEAKKLLENLNNQSMELTKVSGQWTDLFNSHEEFFIINEATIEKLCILGQNVEPCFEGAKITVNFSLKDSLKNLSFMVKDILNKGGNTGMDFEQMYNELKISFDALKESYDKAKNDLSSLTSEYDAYKIKFSDYSEIKEKLEEAESKLTEAQNDYASIKETNDVNENKISEMETELNSLREFKINYDKAQKKALIDSFYMLNDNDKKDVVEHIDSYSLDEIEAKLSILCVRNKVSFNLEDKNDKNSGGDALSFSLNSVIEKEEDDTPAWVKAVSENN